MLIVLSTYKGMRKRGILHPCDLTQLRFFPQTFNCYIWFFKVWTKMKSLGFLQKTSHDFIFVQTLGSQNVTIEKASGTKL